MLIGALLDRKPRMRHRATLLVDAGINLVLGVLLLAFTPALADFLGVPSSSMRFYPSILGAVFIGITLALLVEALRPPQKELIGLGLVGAVCINLCGGLALALWLLFGQLTLPLRGKVLLWSLVAVLVGLSSLELLRALRPQAEARRTED
jgi:hypothetical protein